MKIGIWELRSDPGEDGQWQLQQFEDALLHVLEWCHVIESVAVDCDLRQRQAVKGAEHHLCRRTRSLASGLSWIDTFEGCALVCEVAADHELHQHQHAQRYGQQADQPNDPMCI